MEHETPSLYSFGVHWLVVTFTSPLLADYIALVIVINIGSKILIDKFVTLSKVEKRIEKLNAGI